MEERYTYDPEDLESLLIHKDFNELYPDEKAFVLKHLSGADEYADMQQTMRVLAELSPGEPMHPGSSRKEAVMAEFRRSRKKRAWFSLNSILSLLVVPNRNFLRQPAFQLAMVFVLIAGSLWWYNQSSIHNHAAQLAENRVTEPSERQENGEGLELELESELELELELELESGGEEVDPVEEVEGLSSRLVEETSGEAEKEIELKNRDFAPAETIEELGPVEDAVSETASPGLAEAEQADLAPMADSYTPTSNFSDQVPTELYMSPESTVAFTQSYSGQPLSVESVDRVAKVYTEETVAEADLGSLTTSSFPKDLNSIKVRSQESLISFFHTAM